ncbi:hypothetical protein ABZX51_008839 [Aspergillus tubingensis]
MEKDNLRIFWDDSKLTRLSIRFPLADLTPLRCPFSFPCLAEAQWHTIQSCHPDDRRPTTSPHVGGCSRSEEMQQEVRGRPPCNPSTRTQENGQQFQGCPDGNPEDVSLSSF